MSCVLKSWMTIRVIYPVRHNLPGSAKDNASMDVAGSLGNFGASIWLVLGLSQASSTT